MPKLNRNHVLTALLYSSLFSLIDTSSIDNEANSNTASVTSTATTLTSPAGSAVPTISTCESRTANYITHNLPQQCLRENWTRSSSPTAVSSTFGQAVLNVTVVTASTDASETIASTGDRSTDLAPSEYSQGDMTANRTSNTPSHTGTLSARSTASAEARPAPNLKTPDLEGETEDSPLDNAKFLSFEEWKKQNLAKIGQSPENIGQSRATADGRKRPAHINNALDSLGEEGEIEIEFGFGSGRSDDPPVASSALVDQLSKGADASSEDKHAAAGSPGKRKEAGTTSKERFNYASFDCAATILKTNPRCKSSSSVLVENKDSYLLNECSQDNKFLIVELCDDILIDTIVLANFEFFSSMFRTFRVSISDRYPVKMDRWKELGVFEARNSRDIQAFAVENPLLWTRYLRIEFLTQYGNEYYCPVSLLRVHGTTMMEEFRSQEEPRSEEEDIDIEEHQPVPVRSAEEMLESSPISTSTSAEAEKTTAAKVVEDPDMKYEPDDTPTVGNFSHVASAVNGSSLGDELGTPPGEAAVSSSSQTHNETAATILTELPSMIPVPTDTAHVNSITGAALPASATLLEIRPRTNGSLNDTAISAPEATVNNATSVNVTAPGDDHNANKASQTVHDAAKGVPSTVQSPSASPTTQESFFKSVHKRLQMLESNSTLSLQYIEEQSRILRDAFKEVEKRQMAKAETFLQNLNDTVLTELHGFRQQYDQLWQSTVIELETNRDQYRREMAALSTRLTLMADELVFQKRMAVVQSTLLLLCLGLVLFVRSTGGGGSGSPLELPLMQHVMNKSSTMLRLPFDSPPGSPSSSETSPPSKTASRRSFGAAPSMNGRDSDVSLSPRREKPVIDLAPATPSDGDERSDEDEEGLGMECPGDGLDVREVRLTKSGPATPSGRRENQNPLEWSGGPAEEEVESPPPPRANGDLLASESVSSLEAR